jgi:protein-S-isoprenylcysteine O-methyltransferase Ste14
MMLRHLLSILLLPFLVVIVVPHWLLAAFAATDTRWAGGSPLAWLGSAAGAVAVLAGAALVVWCIGLFGTVGQGTLAPWDPTRRLVAVGPYRFVRNPMISGVALLLAGRALLRGSLLVALWGCVFVALNHIYFLLSEEPGLERRFGDSYRAYKAHVPRWIPRLRPWAGA